MEFEYDPAKSASNKKKHGIDFDEAQEIWNDPDVLEIPAKTIDEPRSIVIGKIRDTMWSAVITVREVKTRIISARRSHQDEVELYES